MTNIKIFKDRLDKLFSDAIGVEDVIWYSETETLRDAICDLVVKFPDEMAACSLIESQRKHSRIRHKRSYLKSITTRLSIEDGGQLSTRLKIEYDPKTDAVVVNPSLSYCGHEIFPRTNRHRSCMSGTAITTLKYKRIYGMRLRAANRIYAKDSK